MKWAWPFACLTFFYTEVISNFQLEQPDQILTIHVGKAITLQCKMKGGDLKSHEMAWYKKNWDNSLIFIYQQREGKYGPDFQRNFLGKIDSDNNTFTLKIFKAAVKDTGTYYCGSVIHASDVHDRGGSLRLIWSY